MTTFLTYNIHYGVGSDGALDLSRIVDVIRYADVVALQEVDRFWDRSGNVDQVRVITEAMPDHYAAWGPSIDLHKDIVRADDSARRIRRQFGNLLLSRFPILSVCCHMLPKYGATELLDIRRSVIEAVVAAPSGALKVYCTHLCHLSDAQRERQVRALLTICANSRIEGPAISGTHPTDPDWTAEDHPDDMPDDTVLLGDLNFVPDSPPYALLAGDLTDRFGAIARRNGFADAWRVGQGSAQAEAANVQAGITRHDRPGSQHGRRIDYCFLSSGLVSRLISAEVMANAEGSDHKPLLVTLRAP